MVRNVGNILDTKYLLNILTYLGAEIQQLSPNKVIINTTNIEPKPIPLAFTSKTNSSFLFVGPMLSRFGEVSIAHPSGDKLGARPVNWHLGALRQLGATVIEKFPHYHIYFDKEPRGGYINLPSVGTVGGTVNVLFASTRAEERTTVINSALEPEIDDVIRFMEKVGFSIKRAPINRIIVEGIKSKNVNLEFDLMPDRVDAATFALAAVLCRGPIILENIIPSHITQLTDLLTRLGANVNFFKSQKNGVGVSVECAEIKYTYLQVQSGRYPAFATDWGPLFQVLMTQIPGESTFHETIFPQRFFHIQELIKMGACAKYFNPANFESNYVFNHGEGPNNYHSLILQRKVAKSQAR